MQTPKLLPLPAPNHQVCVSALPGICLPLQTLLLTSTSIFFPGFPLIWK